MTDAAQRGHCLLQCGVEERCHQALPGSLGGPWHGKEGPAMLAVFLTGVR